MNEYESRNNMVLKVNDVILITIKRIGINGEGIGYYRRLAVFVQGALPGEEVEVKIVQRMEGHAVGEIVRIKRRSPHRIKPSHPVLLDCGCPLQILSYSEQLKEKKKMLKEAFRRYYQKDLEDGVFSDMIGAEKTWGYRNKTQLPVRHDGEKVVAGLYKQGSNRLVHLDEFPQENRIVASVLQEVLELLTRKNISVYNPRFRQGSLRHLVIRGFEETEEAQVTGVLFEKDGKVLKALKEAMEIKYVKSVNYAINSDPRSFEIISGEVVNLAGEKKIKGKLGHLDFLISPAAFFQLNTDQALVLYKEIKKQANLTGNEKVLDLYAGIGSIGLFLADQAGELRGVDNNPENIKDAWEFASLNGIKNATFHAGEILPLLHAFEKEGFVPDLLITDPPRKGMDASVLNHLKKSKIKKSIYVSCNPATLAKNLYHLRGIYEIEKIVPIDLFPNTPHVETVVLITRAK